MIALRTLVIGFCVEGVLFLAENRSVQSSHNQKRLSERQLDSKKDSGGKHEQRTCKDL